MLTTEANENKVTYSWIQKKPSLVKGHGFPLVEFMYDNFQGILRWFPQKIIAKLKWLKKAHGMVVF